MWRRLAVSVATAGCLAGFPAVANASCVGSYAPGEPATLRVQLEAAPTVFVGTVIATSNGDRVARVRVQSVWRGAPIPGTVTVSGTPDQASAATSVDRTFTIGQRYLFAPSSRTSPFEDSSCSATRAYSRQLDALKPATAVAPAPGSDGLDGPAGVLGSATVRFGLVPVAALLLLGGGQLYRRLRRPSL